METRLWQISAIIIDIIIRRTILIQTYARCFQSAYPIKGWAWEYLVNCERNLVICPMQLSSPCERRRSAQSLAVGRRCFEKVKCYINPCDCYSRALPKEQNWNTQQQIQSGCTVFLWKLDDVYSKTNSQLTVIGCDSYPLKPTIV